MPISRFKAVRAFLSTNRRTLTRAILRTCADTAPGKPWPLRLIAFLGLYLLLPMIIVVAPRVLIRCPSLHRGRR